MKTVFAVIGTTIGVLALCFGLAFLFRGENLALNSFFGTKEANVERNIYEQSHSYTKGMVQELYSMKFDYEKQTDPKVKAALAGSILHTAADFDEDKLPSDLRSFISELRNQ